MCFLRKWEELLLVRGGVEHRELKLSQLRREVVTTVNGDPIDHYTYTEYGSKSRSGGLKQLRQENKVVHQYESANAARCPVRLLDKYISKLPPDAKKNDVFYLKPKANTPHDPMAPWFIGQDRHQSQPLGPMV